VAWPPGSESIFAEIHRVLCLILRELLYYCPSSLGGIVDYAHIQASALAKAGVDVTLLTAGTQSLQDSGISVVRSLEDESRPIDLSNRFLRQVRRTGLIRANILRLKEYILSSRIQHVMLASYSEYAAPLWSRHLRSLARSGVRFSAVLHDPVRDYVVGPKWWHKRSIRSGYSFLSDAFVHEEVDRAEIGIPDHVHLTVIPHGPSDFPRPTESGGELRCRLGIPPTAKLLLSFGQIRNGKNLDLTIRAMRHFDNFWLLVAGKEAGGLQRPLTYYRSLAEECGVADRCRWISDYIPSDQVGGLFATADLVILTYSKAFRSASGVLNTAVQFRKPCLVSSGPGALRTQVQRYRLGIWVEPDEEESIRRGMQQSLEGLPNPLHAEYLEENSWRRNAELVRDRLFTPQ
jgi:Glycosyl transferases group 1